MLALVMIAVQALASCIAGGSTAESETLGQEASPLVVVGARSLSQRLLEITVFSPAMESQTTFRLLLPKQYDPHAATRYPVIFLLHGCCNGDRGFSTWTEAMDLESFTHDLPMILVMPEGGHDGLYSDWYNGGGLGPPRWETYHIRELLPWIEQHYRVRTDRGGRMLLGISMGGHGAFAYAARYPDLFGSASAISPALDSGTFANRLTIGLSALLGEGPGDQIWGPRITESIRWRGHNPVDLAENLQPVSLFIRSGNGQVPGGLLAIDLAEAAVHQMAVNMSRALSDAGIPYQFDDYGPGTHTVEFFQESVHRLIPQQLLLAEQAPPSSSGFSYRSIEPRFSVFDWSLSFQRDVIEFARLADVTKNGFTLSGSGRADIETPAVYGPGRRYRVLTDAGTRFEVRADSQGRLRFSIDLGPSRRIQQGRLGSASGFLRSVSVRLAPVLSE